jgi:hypothetical protein
MAPRRTPKSAAILSDPTAAPHIPLITRTCGCRLERAPPLNRCRHPTAAGTVMPFDATRRPFDKLRCTSISEREAPLRPAASPARHGKRRASTRVPLFRERLPEAQGIAIARAPYLSPLELKAQRPCEPSQARPVTLAGAVRSWLPLAGCFAPRSLNSPRQQNLPRGFSSPRRPFLVSFGGRQS